MGAQRDGQSFRGLLPFSGNRRQLIVVLALLLPGLLCAQVIRYAAPMGTGAEDGSDWDNAYGVTNLQAAVDAAIAGGAGSVLYLQEGEYALTNQLDIAAAAGLTLSGGWVGSGGAPGEPGDPGTEETVLTRDSGAGDMRIIYAESSTLMLTNLTVTGGLNTPGAGLYLDDCITSIANSRIVSNVVTHTTSAPGVGIHATGGTLVLVNSDVSDNHQTLTTGGGAVAVFIATMSI